MANGTTNAMVAYEQTGHAIRATIESIERKLREHNDRRREHYGSWDYVGDVTEVLKRLQEVSAFIGADR